MTLPESPDSVVTAGRCCGCGVCAGVAICGQMQMLLTRDGFWEPAAANCTACGACTATCPGRESPVPDPAAPLGNHLATVVGYSTFEDERLRGSSGGLATRVLKALLERGEIDAAVGVRATGHGDPLFETAALRTPREIQATAGSKYYPVEFSRPLQELRASGERFALVGVPCVMTALRLGRERFPWLRKQCVALIGLACGHMVSTRYTGFLAEISGVPAAELTGAEFRRKPGPRSAADFIFAATGADGREGREVPFVTGGGIPVAVWGARLFTPPACFRCADLFAVDADLSLMDAWLREYTPDRAGTSLAVVRTEAMRELLEAESAAGRLLLEPIEPDRVVRSQSSPLVNRRMATALRRAENGARMPVGVALTLWWERLRARLSNRLPSTPGPGRSVGIAAIRAWLVLYRPGRTLRRRAIALAGRTLRLLSARRKDTERERGA